MNNVLNFKLTADELSGVEGEHMYLGTVPHDGYITGALREFNLPNTVAPGEWPNPGEGVTCEQDPRHKG